MAMMTQAQMDEWIAQNGGATLQHGVEQKQIKNPDYDKYDPEKGPEYIMIDVETWRNSKTGATISAVHKPDGSWERQEIAAADPNKPPPGNTRTPEQTRIDQASADKAQEEARNAQKLNWERDWHEKQGHGRYTHAEWEQKFDKDRAEAVAQGNQARANQLADERIKWEKERANLPDIKVESKEVNGVVYTVVTTVPKDGKTPPVIKTYGTDGKEVPGGLPAARKGGKLPPGVNPPQFSRGNVAKELARFNAELDQAVSRGEITKEEALGFYTPYHQEASTFLQELNNADTQDQNATGQQLTQRSQDATVAGNRMNWSNSAFQNAAQQDNNMLMGAAGTGRSALVPLLALQAGLTNAAGGFKDQPAVEVRRYPEQGKPVPASIAPVINATNAAPSGVAAGTKPAPLLPPKPPVSAATASATAAQASAASPAPAASALPRDAQGNAPADPPLNIVNRKTGERRQIKLSEINALPDRADWDVIDPNGSGSVSAPAPKPAVSPPAWVPDTGGAYAPQMAGPGAGATGDPLEPGVPVNMKPEEPPMRPFPGLPGQTLPVDVGGAGGGNVQMVPRSIQPAMPGQPQAPDIEAITAKMLADGVNPMDVMEIRKRWAGQAA